MSDAPGDDPIYLDGEDIRCLGMYLADSKPFFPRDWDKIFAASGRARRSRKPPKPTLAKIAADARKAGISIASIEIKADGSFTVITSKPELAESENPWRAEFQTKETKK